MDCRTVLISGRIQFFFLPIKEQEVAVIRPAGHRLSRIKLFNPYPANVENMVSS